MFFSTGSIGEVPILLVKPQSYMNYSGEAVGPLAAYYQVPLRHILLVSVTIFMFIMCYLEAHFLCSIGHMIKVGMAQYSERPQWEY